MAKKAKFILHWLNNSRANRILWALEILGLDYEVKVYLRDKSYRAPKTLYEVDGSGKSPILEVIFEDGSKPLKLTESGLILQYLLWNYDPGHVLYPENEDEQRQVNYYLHFSEGTLQPLLVSLLINSLAPRMSPFGFKSITRLITKEINNGYYLTELKLCLKNLENHLKEKESCYFVGESLTGADVILSFPLFENLFDNEERVQNMMGEKINLYKQFPNLGAWAKAVRSNPLYIRINEMMEEKTLQQEKAGSKV
ncbi:Piso0_001242 [Millerozyma farinosa CBS 7064]|uniref:Piso0_001242 protein n=1 Tax=Pichia sorbitophila (strain ATCC MYA-4447 / BCRC 22081 / CBS 7064 / NBRC 10061 / NRRL Y-12695) TaxID=559304 RepID=G8YMM6_PICSO|nr:Piso0_001242 [Millerozyma farinosa CBS 7064]